MRSLEQIPSLFVLMLEGHLKANTYVNIDIRHYTNCFLFFRRWGDKRSANRSPFFPNSIQVAFLCAARFHVNINSNNEKRKPYKLWLFMIHIARALFDETSSSGKPGPVLFDGSMVPVLYIFIIRCCTTVLFWLLGYGASKVKTTSETKQAIHRPWIHGNNLLITLTVLLLIDDIHQDRKEWRLRTQPIWPDDIYGNDIAL